MKVSRLGCSLKSKPHVLLFLFGWITYLLLFHTVFDIQPTSFLAASDSEVLLREAVVAPQRVVANEEVQHKPTKLKLTISHVFSSYVPKDTMNRAEMAFVRMSWYKAARYLQECIQGNVMKVVLDGSVVDATVEIEFIDVVLRHELEDVRAYSYQQSSVSDAHTQHKLIPLDRAFINFEHREVPMIGDIFRLGYQASVTDEPISSSKEENQLSKAYLVYTNMDIAVTKTFYVDILSHFGLEITQFFKSLRHRSTITQPGFREKQSIEVYEAWKAFMSHCLRVGPTDTAKELCESDFMVIFKDHGFDLSQLGSELHYQEIRKRFALKYVFQWLQSSVEIAMKREQVQHEKHTVAKLLCASKDTARLAVGAHLCSSCPAKGFLGCVLHQLLPTQSRPIQLTQEAQELLHSMTDLQGNVIFTAEALVRLLEGEQIITKELVHQLHALARLDPETDGSHSTTNLAALTVTRVDVPLTSEDSAWIEPLSQVAATPEQRAELYDAISHRIMSKVKREARFHPGNDCFVIDKKFLSQSNETQAGSMRDLFQLLHPIGLRPWGSYVRILAKHSSPVKTSKLRWKRIIGSREQLYTFHLGTGLWRYGASKDSWNQQAKQQPAKLLFIQAMFYRVAQGHYFQTISNPPKECKQPSALLQMYRASTFCNKGQTSFCRGTTRYTCVDYLHPKSRDVQFAVNHCAPSTLRKLFKTSKIPVEICDYCQYVMMNLTTLKRWQQQQGSIGGICGELTASSEHESHIFSNQFIREY